jgi:hypothetical protein
MSPYTKAMNAYGEWLRKYSGWVLPVEDSLRQLIMFMPGRFSGDGEMRAELLYSVLNVVAQINDSVLETPRQISCGVVGADATAVTRFSQTTLHSLRIFAVLLEMAARRRFDTAAHRRAGVSSRRTWLSISAIEALKAAARLYLLYHQRGRMLVVESDDEVLAAYERRRRRRAAASLDCGDGDGDGDGDDNGGDDDGDDSGGGGNGADDAGVATRARCRRRLFSLNLLRRMYVERGRGDKDAHGEFNELVNVNVNGDINDNGNGSGSGKSGGGGGGVAATVRETTAYTPTRGEVAAELLHVLRPCVYTLGQALVATDSADAVRARGTALRRAQWLPWLASAVVDVVSNHLATRNVDKHENNNKNNNSGDVGVDTDATSSSSSSSSDVSGSGSGGVGGVDGVSDDALVAADAAAVDAGASVSTATTTPTTLTTPTTATTTTSSSSSPPSPPLSPGQQRELERRRRAWLYYLLRSPMFETSLVRVPLTKIFQLLSRVPIVGILAQNMLDLILTLQTHYFYTSASD